MLYVISLLHMYVHTQTHVCAQMYVQDLRTQELL